MNEQSSIKTSANKVNEVEKIKDVVDKAQKVVGEVDTITKVISNTLYIRGNVAVDLQNYSLISISDPKTIL
jgi:hypothetical protein